MVISTLIILFWKMLEKISNIFSQRITYEGKILKSFGTFCLSKMIFWKWIHSVNICQKLPRYYTMYISAENQWGWMNHIFLLFWVQINIHMTYEKCFGNILDSCFCLHKFFGFYSLGDDLMVQPSWDIILGSQKVMGLNKYCAILHF